MNRYFRLPTHTPYGWLFFLLCLVIVGLMNIILGGNMPLAGPLQMLFLIASIIEIVANIKNRIKTKSE